MADTTEQIGTDIDVSANDAVLNDLGPIDGDGLGATPSQATQIDSDEIAQNPDIQDAFSRVFGTPKQAVAANKSVAAAGTAKATATRRGQSHEEEVEELEGLDGLDELDDGAEPKDELGKDADKNIKSQKVKDILDGERKGEGKEGADEAPTLSPILKQAAKRAGWNDDDIDELAKVNPELAEKTFSKMLKSFNDISAEFGRIGLAHMQRTVPQQAAGFQPPVQQQTQQPVKPFTPQGANGQGADILTQMYGQERLTALQEKYGADMVEDLVAPLVAPVLQMQQAQQQQEMQATAREVNGFFSNLGEDFHDLYGNSKNVSEAQMQSRYQLAQLADQIQTGAKVQGLHLSVSECLERANLQFAAEHLGALERKKITRQVQNRSKSITQRPSQRKISAGAGDKPSIQNAIDAYSRRANELGLEVM